MCFYFQWCFIEHEKGFFSRVAAKPFWMQSKLKPSFFMMSMPITSLPTKNTEQEPRDHPLLKSIEAFYFFLCNFLLDFCPFYASLQSIRFLRVIAWKKSFSTTRNRKSPDYLSTYTILQTLSLLPDKDLCYSQRCSITFFVWPLSQMRQKLSFDVCTLFKRLLKMSYLFWYFPSIFVL